MKGMISLVDFIKEVKKELREAVDNEDPFFEMGEVELEVSFALDASAKAGIKLFVADFGGQTKATQIHKVKIKLNPFVEEKIASLPATEARANTGTVKITNPRHVKVTSQHKPGPEKKPNNLKPKASRPTAAALKKSTPRAG